MQAKEGEGIVDNRGGGTHIQAKEEKNKGGEGLCC